MNFDEKTVISNIIQIRTNKGFNKREMAKALNINEASYGRLENGKVALSYNHLALLARKFEVSVIDIIAYPNKYVLSDDNDKTSEPLEAVLQIRLKSDKRDQMLKLMFGENNLEILNK